MNHHKKIKAEPSWLISQKLTENVELSTAGHCYMFRFHLTN